MSAKMIKLFEQVHKIPQVPEVVRLLISQFNDPDVEIKDIAGNVAKEQLIALKVLRLVNSAQFGLRKKIASIDEAVVMLGMGQLRGLVIASGIVSSVPAIEDFDINQFWLASFNTATYAKWLAGETQCDADIAFTAALLRGLGTLLIHLGQPKAAADIQQRINEGQARHFIEKMRLGFSTEEVSAELCKRWKFSDDLIVPIAQSGDPATADPVSKIACVVHIGNYFSDCKHKEMSEEDILQSFPVDILELLGLSEVFINENLSTILALESGMDGLLG